MTSDISGKPSSQDPTHAAVPLAANPLAAPQALPTRRTALLNARILDPSTNLDVRGDLFAEKGRIADFGPAIFPDGPPQDALKINCNGMVLAPGLVDMRVHLGEPGHEQAETIASGAAAAVAGGITTLASLPNTNPVIDDVSLVEFIARRARETKLVKIHPYAAVTRGLDGKALTEIGTMSRAGAVAFCDGDHWIADALVMRRALAYARNFDALIVQHPEEPSLAKGGLMTEGEMSSRLGMAGIPAAAEVIAVERDLRLLSLTGGRLHFAHVSTHAAIDAIRKAKEAGLAVTCDTAPPYALLNINAVGDYRTFAKLSPPLRTEDDRQSVLAGLADGTIDALASDHMPHDQDSKRLPFPAAAFGGVGMETLLSAALSLHHSGTMDLHKALGLVTYKPADLLRVEAGRIAVGHPADLALIDIDRGWKVSESSLRSKSKNSPFDGLPMTGRAVRTLVDGRTVYTA